MPPFESRAGDAGRLVGWGLLPRVRFHLVPLLLAFALVLSASLAAGASASVVSSGGFKYVTKNFTLNPGKALTYRAECPKRTHVLSGGHYNNGTFGDVIGAHSYPYDNGDPGRKPDDGWAAQLRGFTESYDVSIYAICAKLLPEYSSTVRAFEAGPVSVGGWSPTRCENTSLKVISGGSRAPVSAREVSSFPSPSSSGERWNVKIANHGQQAQDVTLFGVCTGLATDWGTGSDTAQSETQESAFASCPKATPHVVGGGVSVNGINSTNDAWDAAIAATRPSADMSGWDVWVDNYNGTPPETLGINVYAVCSAPL